MICSCLRKSLQNLRKLKRGLWLVTLMSRWCSRSQNWRRNSHKSTVEQTLFYLRMNYWIKFQISQRNWVNRNVTHLSKTVKSGTQISKSNHRPTNKFSRFVRSLIRWTQIRLELTLWRLMRKHINLHWKLTLSQWSENKYKSEPNFKI